MKATIYNNKGEKGKQIDLPKQFNEEVRPDLIKKAVLIVQANKRQSYGAMPRAGKQHSAKLSRRRRDFKGAYGRGISRVPRKTMLRRGTQFIWTAAFAPGTTGGRRSHPPKGEKDFSLRINKKEKRKAIRSAISATLDKEFLKKKGFSCLDNVPLIIEKLEDLKKTKEVKILLEKLGLKNDLQRITKTVRAGRGKARGRKYKVKKGPLVVLTKENRAFDNLLGFDTCLVEKLNTELLAPGAEPGRLVVWSIDSINKLEKEKLFMLDKPKPVKENGSI